ncbi:MAG: WXG100 family type VII secretion target [Clostridia bacterium]|nr:WXG100 family type VII secretion target [Clostridia bacterium]
MSNKLYVSTEKLTGYGNTLNNQSTEFKAIRNRMENIVANLKSSWGGKDARTFYSNATEYLDNLAVIENALDYYGYKVKRKSNKYDKRCSSFYDSMRGKNNGIG